MKKKEKLQRNFVMITDARDDGIERVFKSTDGMHLDKFLSNPNLTSMFRRGGLYMISVDIPAFDKYIKIGLSSNLVARLSGHRTSLYPVHAHIRVHCLAMKRTDLNPDLGESKTAKVSFMYKAEQKVKAYLEKIKIVPKGEWYQIAIPDLIKIFLNEHFGDQEENIRGDGLNCPFYVLNSHKCFRINKEMETNKIVAEQRTRSSRNKQKQIIKEVIGKRKRKGRWEYLVRYKNNDKEEVWVYKAEVVKNAPDQMREYDRDGAVESDEDNEDE